MIKKFNNLLSKNIKNYYNHESTVYGNDDINSTIYEGIVGYRELMIENGKIKSLKAHYYLNK